MKIVTAVLVAAFALTSSPALDARTISMAGAGAPPSLGNPYGSVGQPVWGSIYDALTVQGVDGTLKPALALSWEAITPTTWRLTLREDVFFHNGTPFNAEAAAATLNFLLEPSSRRYVVAAEMKNVERIEVIDSTTLDIILSQPDAVLPKRLNLIYIVEPNLWRDLGPEEFALAPVGTGPFRLEDWGRTTGRMIIKSVESGSFRPSKEVTEVDIVSLNDAAARIQALLSNRVDISTQLSPDDIPLLEANGYNVLKQPTPIIMSIALRNVRDENVPLKDVRVRQALNYAVNKQAIAQVIMSGLVEPATQGVATGTFGHNPDLEGFPYNPDKARALLAEAGYPDGFDFVIEALIGLTPNDTLLYTQMIQDLARVGVNAELRGIPFANFVGKYVTGQWEETDAFSLTWNAAPFNDAARPLEQFSCTKSGAFFCEPSLTPLIEASTKEMDIAKREALLQGIMADFNQAAPSILLVSQTLIFGMAPEIEVLKTRFGGVEFEEITFAD